MSHDTRPTRIMDAPNQPEDALVPASGATRIMDYPKPAVAAVAPEKGATRIMDAPTPQENCLESSRFARGKTLVMSWPVAQAAHVEPPAAVASGALVPEAVTTPVELLAAEPRSTRQDAVFEALGEGNPTRIVSPAEWLTQLPAPTRTSAGSSASAELAEGNQKPRIKASRLWSREVAWFKTQSLTRRISIVLFPFALGSAASVFLGAPATSAPTTASRTAVAPAASLAQAAPSPEQTSTARVAEATEPAPTPSLPMGMQKSLQRQAADALAEGNYAAARTLYQSLVASEPNNAAYGAAVRLLDRRLAKRR